MPNVKNHKLLAYVRKIHYARARGFLTNYLEDEHFLLYSPTPMRDADDFCDLLLRYDIQSTFASLFASFLPKSGNSYQIFVEDIHQFIDQKIVYV